MKKKLAMMLAIMLLTIVITVTAEDEQPEHFVSNDYTYILQEDSTAIILYYKSNNDVSITIPEELDGYKVTSIGDNAFKNKKTLKAVVIPEGITSIGENAFASCTSLETIILPSSLCSIGISAFLNCISLTEITIPENVTRIEPSTFFYCESLTEISFSDNVTYIGDSAFSGCSKLKAITIPSGITSIEDSTFLGCESLTSITIPDSVTSIGDYAFRFCYGLTEITIPDSVTYIGKEAFYMCKNLALITLPSGDIEFAKDSFKSTPYAVAMNEMIPKSFDGAEDYRLSNWIFPEGKKIFTFSSYFYSSLPTNIRTLNPSEADYILTTDVSGQSRSDYTGWAHDTITSVYLCGRDGTIALLCSITNSPPLFGTVKIGQSLGGSVATDEELWEKIKKFFP